MKEGFYRAFEDKFRGSRETIRTRLTIYLPFLRLLFNYFKPEDVIDLGCGRGEWLELLRMEGISARGVDLDQGMLEACRELDLVVINQDAIKFLETLPNESQSVVTAFHLVEHVPFDSLLQMLGQAYRVLKPGGLLILETPNSDNLVVATSTFYLDPTHQRPIPPDLLLFATKNIGFKRNKLMRLQESESLKNSSMATLLDVISGASPDYAVVAQKEGPDILFQILEDLFNAEFGLTLSELAVRFQSNLDSRLAQIQTQADQSEARAQLQSSRLIAVYESSTWRLTAPIRSTFDTLHAFRRKYNRESGKACLRKLLIELANFLKAHPNLTHLIKCGVQHTRVAKPIRRIYLRLSYVDDTTKTHLPQFEVIPNQIPLGPRARNILMDLKSAIHHQSSEIS
jgi:O-antigen chain-terminating methyltransferase